MFTKIFSIFTTIFFLLFFACSKEKNPPFSSVVQWTDINEPNMVDLDFIISNTTSSFVYTLAFNKKMIISDLKISDYQKGKGSLELVDSTNNIIYTLMFDSDTTITSNFSDVFPKKLNIYFEKFDGSFSYDLY